MGQDEDYVFLARQSLEGLGLDDWRLVAASLRAAKFRQVPSARKGLIAWPQSQAVSKAVFELAAAATADAAPPDVIKASIPPPPDQTFLGTGTWHWHLALAPDCSATWQPV
ncbi:uncharacterized protein UV8b_07971 [Ustilaginoidea virens]|uniref:Uncharacterized protein n=1 Tax=Ustilaginoidea virens TaxID=1159556 RepID=A0A8E5HYI5_USTVR|nr:uncharacterized protein UV8b_07971 [Ustilaginoidea virens]QUC23730.1 hypothetical protein UV8b_07971 [Ustilaginoidea virens]